VRGQGLRCDAGAIALLTGCVGLGEGPVDLCLTKVVLEVDDLLAQSLLSSFTPTSRNTLTQTNQPNNHSTHPPQLGKLNKAQLIREIKLHGSFAHRNIVELWCSFQEGNQVALVQKFCEQGDLLKLLQKCGGRMNERAAVQVVIHPLLTVLLYLHARGVTHRWAAGWLGDWGVLVLWTALLQAPATGRPTNQAYKVTHPHHHTL